MGITSYLEDRRLNNRREAKEIIEAMASQKIVFLVLTLTIALGLLTSTNALSSQTNLWQGKRSESGQAQAPAVRGEFIKRGLCTECYKHCPPPSNAEEDSEYQK